MKYDLKLMSSSLKAFYLFKKKSKLLWATGSIYTKGMNQHATQERV